MSTREQRRQRRASSQQILQQEIYQQLRRRRLHRGQQANDAKDWETAETVARHLIRSRLFKLSQRFQSSWRQLISWYESTPLEHALETLATDLKNVAIFDLLSLLANITIILSLGAFLMGGERQLHDGQVYNAWQVITNAHGQPGNGGRRRALEFLNSTPGTPGRRRWFGLPWPRESLQGIDVTKANLTGIELPNADLEDADLQDALLEGANLQNANLLNANLQDALLGGANLQNANLSNANLQNAVFSKLDYGNWIGNIVQYADLQNANLGGANLQDTSLVGVNLQNANLSGANLQNANLSGANLREGLDLASFSSALLLNTNLEGAQELTQWMLSGNRTLSGGSASVEGVLLPVVDPPLLCNTALPPHIEEIDPNRDCDRMPQALLDYSNRWAGLNPGYTPIKLEEVTDIVEEARQKTWDE